MAAQPNVSKEQYMELALQAAAPFCFTLDGFEFDDKPNRYVPYANYNGIPVQLPSVNHKHSQQMVYAILTHKFSNDYITQNIKER